MKSLTKRGILMPMSPLTSWITVVLLWSTSNAALLAEPANATWANDTGVSLERTAFWIHDAGENVTTCYALLRTVCINVPDSVNEEYFEPIEVITAALACIMTFASMFAVYTVLVSTVNKLLRCCCKDNKFREILEKSFIPDPLRKPTDESATVAEENDEPVEEKQDESVTAFFWLLQLALLIWYTSEYFDRIIPGSRYDGYHACGVAQWGLLFLYKPVNVPIFVCFSNAVSFVLNYEWRKYKVEKVYLAFTVVTCVLCIIFYMAFLTQVPLGFVFIPLLLVLGVGLYMCVRAVKSWINICTFYLPLATGGKIPWFPQLPCSSEKPNSPSFVAFLWMEAWSLLLSGPFYVIARGPWAGCCPPIAKTPARFVMRFFRAASGLSSFKSNKVLDEELQKHAINDLEKQRKVYATLTYTLHLCLFKSDLDEVMKKLKALTALADPSKKELVAIIQCGAPCDELWRQSEKLVSSDGEERNQRGIHEVLNEFLRKVMVLLYLSFYMVAPIALIPYYADSSHSTYTGLNGVLVALFEKMFKTSISLTWLKWPDWNINIEMQFAISISLVCIEKVLVVWSAIYYAVGKSLETDDDKRKRIEQNKRENAKLQRELQVEPKIHQTAKNPASVHDPQATNNDMRITA